MKSNNFQKGLVGQNLVQKYLENLSFELISANFQFYLGRKSGEIDLIMFKDNRLHLIEVKLRTNSKFGKVAEQITKTKLQTLARAWQYFILKNPQFKKTFCQFDAAFVSFPQKMLQNNSQTSIQNPSQNQNQNQLFEEINQNLKTEIITKIPKTIQSEKTEKSNQNLPISVNLKDKMAGNLPDSNSQKTAIDSDFPKTFPQIEIIWNAYQFD